MWTKKDTSVVAGWTKMADDDLSQLKMLKRDNM